MIGAGLRVGVVVGLAFEARLAVAAAGRRGRTGEVRVLCAGGDPGRAAEAAERLAADGARLVLSAGLCGGLDPALRAGDLVLPTEVRRAGHPAIALDPAARARAYAALATVARLLPEPLVSADAPVGEPAAKRALLLSAGARAVDVETYAVAAACRPRGVPCLALRAVADLAGDRLPAAALRATDAAGAVRPGRAAAALLRRPGDLAALLRLAARAAAARVALRRALRLLLARRGALDAREVVADLALVDELRRPLPG